MQHELYGLLPSCSGLGCQSAGESTKSLSGTGLLHSDYHLCMGHVSGCACTSPSLLVQEAFAAILGRSQFCPHIHLPKKINGTPLPARGAGVCSPLRLLGPHKNFHRTPIQPFTPQEKAPPQENSPTCVQVVYYLSGLTCTDENFIQKAGAQRKAAELGLALVAPDTSPRGVGVPGEADSWDFGVGAGKRGREGGREGQGCTLHNYNRLGVSGRGEGARQ